MKLKQNRIKLLKEAVQTYKKYFGNSGAGGVFFSENTSTILWAKRATKGVKEGGQWTAVFGGRVEENEDPITAVIREIKEELKFNEKYTIFRNPMYTFVDQKENFMYKTYKILVNHEFKPTLNWEHTEFIWLSKGKTPSGKIHFGTNHLIKANFI